MNMRFPTPMAVLSRPYPSRSVVSLARTLDAASQQPANELLD